MLQTYWEKLWLKSIAQLHIIFLCVQFLFWKSRAHLYPLHGALANMEEMLLGGSCVEIGHLGAEMGCPGGQGMVCKGKTKMGQWERWKGQVWKADLTPGEKTETRTELGKQITQQKPAAGMESQWVKFEMSQTKWLVTKLRNQSSATAVWPSGRARRWAGWLPGPMQVGYSPQRLRPRGAA